MSLRPAEGGFATARTMFKDLRDRRLKFGEARSRALKADLARIDKQVEQFLGRIADSETSSVTAAYEKRVNKLEAEKIVISEKMASSGRPMRGFDETLRTALDFPSNPWNL